MQDRIRRLDWLKSLRAAGQAMISRTEDGLHLLGAEGDEHMRDAVEAWLEQQRAFILKLERRIAAEETRGG
jgi:hypothetical protein